MQSTAPWLLLAVGNPSRGDDALGPALLERISMIEADADDVEFLVDFQLQVEHAMDLQGRQGVLFIDAARPGFLEATAQPDRQGAAIARLSAAEHVPVASHALKAEAVMYVSCHINADVPPSWQLAIEGECFSLGEGLSRLGRAHLNSAVLLARAWLAERRNSITQKC